MSPGGYDPRDPPHYQIPAPTCAACGGKLVDRVRYWFSPAREGYVVEAYCHGEMEASLIPVRDILAGATVAEAVAFVRKLEGPDA